MRMRRGTTEPCCSGTLELSRTPIARISAGAARWRSYGPLASWSQQPDLAAHLFLALRP